MTESRDPDTADRTAARWGARSRLHADGWPLIGAAAAATVVLAALVDGLGWLALLATVWVAAGFRVPRRAAVTSDGAGLRAPIDGRVALIEPAVPPSGLDLGVGPVTRIRLAPGPFDSRVVVAPAAARVVARDDPGPPPRWWPGFLARGAGMKTGCALALEDDRHVGLVLRAGRTAPGARLDVDLDDRVEPGRPVGTLRLAGVVDVYLPPAASARVVEGQRTVAGETAL